MRIPCPHCSAALDIRDDKIGQTLRCPSCKRQLVVPGEPPRNHLARYAGAGFAALAVIATLSAIFLRSDSPPPETKPQAEVAPVEEPEAPPETIEERITREGYALAERLIPPHLRAPATTKFVPESTKIDRSGDTVYDVTGELDSQNGFGALLRSGWRIRIAIIEDELKPIGLFFDGARVRDKEVDDRWEYLVDPDVRRHDQALQEMSDATSDVARYTAQVGYLVHIEKRKLEYKKQHDKCETCGKDATAVDVEGETLIPKYKSVCDEHRKPE